MANEDPTKKLPNDDRTDRTTQPIIEELVAEIRALRNGVAGQELRFNSIDARFDSIDARFDSVDARFDSVDARFDSVDARLDVLESRLVHDIEGVNGRITEVGADMTRRFIGLENKLEALNRSRLQAEGDYFNLAQRVTDLESKIS